MHVPVVKGCTTQDFLKPAQPFPTPLLESPSLPRFSPITPLTNFYHPSTFLYVSVAAEQWWRNQVLWKGGEQRGISERLFAHFLSKHMAPPWQGMCMGLWGEGGRCPQVGEWAPPMISWASYELGWRVAAPACNCN